MNAVKDNLQAFRTKYSELLTQTRTVHGEKEELQAQLSQKTLELEQFKSLQVQIDGLKAEKSQLQEVHKDELARLRKQFEEEKAKLQGLLETERTNVTTVSVGIFKLRLVYHCHLTPSRMHWLLKIVNK